MIKLQNLCFPDPETQPLPAPKPLPLSAPRPEAPPEFCVSLCFFLRPVLYYMVIIKRLNKMSTRSESCDVNTESSVMISLVSVLLPEFY